MQAITAEFKVIKANNLEDLAKQLNILQKKYLTVKILHTQEADGKALVRVTKFKEKK